MSSDGLTSAAPASTASTTSQPLDISAIQNLIEQHEGKEATAYRDTEGNLTIGVGFNLDAEGAQQQIEALGLNYASVCDGQVSLSDAQINTLFDSSVNTAIAGARACVSNFDSLPSEKQAVVVDMVYNLGESGFSQFKETIAAIEQSNFAAAAAQMKDSEWYTQVGTRGVQDVALMAQPVA